MYGDEYPVFLPKKRGVSASVISLTATIIITMTLTLIIIITQDSITVDLIKPISKSKAHLWHLNCFTIFSILTTTLAADESGSLAMVDASSSQSEARYANMYALALAENF
jgi:hypothetical protein